jgi:hypothetical protein
MAGDFLGRQCSGQELVDEVPAWASGIEANPEQVKDCESPLDRVSTWKAPATQPATSTEGDANHAAEHLETPAEVMIPWKPTSAAAASQGEAEDAEEAVAPNLPQASFIERYAHIFADEPGDDAPATEPARQVASEPLASNLRTVGTVGSVSASRAAATSDDEESIEQYMAKLLQRVRGDAPADGPSPQRGPVEEVARESTIAVSPTPSAIAGTISSESTASAKQADIESRDGDDVEVPINWDAFARRAAQPTTDLGALRALANESARRAISHHGLRKHRADAVTKVIVSALAGMTSLWLMLESPNWRNIQFIVGCVSLIMAAYWAGEACRAMLESFRAAAYGGPGAEKGAVESDDESLPIDVEASP